MPTYLLTCQTCGGRRPFFFGDDLEEKTRAQIPITIACPVCRKETNWKLVSVERRLGEDRRQFDRRAMIETWYVHLTSDGSTAAEVDKRNFPRYLSPPGSYVVYQEGSGAVEDLSLGGLFIADRKPLRQGSFVNLELRLGSHTIPVKGMVRRSVPGEGMGIEFLEMPPEGKRRLKLFLANLAAPVDEG